MLIYEKDNRVFTVITSLTTPHTIISTIGDNVNVTKCNQKELKALHKELLRQGFNVKSTFKPEKVYQAQYVM